MTTKIYKYSLLNRNTINKNNPTKDDKFIFKNCWPFSKQQLDNFFIYKNEYNNFYNNIIKLMNDQTNQEKEEYDIHLGGKLKRCQNIIEKINFSINKIFENIKIRSSITRKKSLKTKNENIRINKLKKLLQKIFKYQKLLISSVDKILIKNKLDIIKNEFNLNFNLTRKKHVPILATGGTYLALMAATASKNKIKEKHGRFGILKNKHFYKQNNYKILCVHQQNSTEKAKRYGNLVKNIINYTKLKYPIHIEILNSNEKDITKRKAIIHVKINNKSEYISLPIIYHKDLPVDGEIPDFYVYVKKHGKNTKYFAEFVVNSNNHISNHVYNNTNNFCAIDLGWRKNNNGSFTVGTGCDNNGNIFDCILPQIIINEFEKSNYLQKISENIFNAVKKELKTYTNNNAEFKTVCETLLPNEKFSHTHMWKKHGILCKLSYELNKKYSLDIENIWYEWQKETILDVSKINKKGKHPCFKSDDSRKKDLFGHVKKQNIKNIEDKFEYDASQILLNISGWIDRTFKIKYSNDEKFIIFLEFWRRKNNHLFELQRNVAMRAILNRNNLYRQYAIKLRENYDKIYFEGTDKKLMNIADMATKSDPGDKDVDNRSSRMIVAPGEFRKIIIDVLGQKKEEYPWLYKTKWSTLKCNQCDNFCAYENNNKASKILICKNCNIKIDRDINSSINGINEILNNKLSLFKKTNIIIEQKNGTGRTVNIDYNNSFVLKFERLNALKTPIPCRTVVGDENIEGISSYIWQDDDLIKVGDDEKQNRSQSGS